MMPKLVCIFENIVNESGAKSKNPRYKLIGKRYFCGLYEGSKSNERLWEEVADYIETMYDTDYLEIIYVAGDGAGWIKTGCEYLEKGHYILDKFHMAKYINRSTAHLYDSAPDVKARIWGAIGRLDKKELKAVYEEILKVTESENKIKDVEKALRYFLNNWHGIKEQVENTSGLRYCIEGQISHVLSARLSSRPLGWSKVGCDNMARLRAFNWNGGNVIDLLTYQKEKKLKEKKREEQEELIRDLRKRASIYTGTTYSIPGAERKGMRWLKEMTSTAWHA